MGKNYFKSVVFSIYKKKKAEQIPLSYFTFFFKKKKLKNSLK